MKDTDLKDVFLFKLETTAKQFKRYKNRVFKEKDIDITSDQWILLKSIFESEGINQTELAKRCKKEAAAVTRTLDILGKKQWIVRKADPKSRRVYLLYTTASGKKRVEQLLPIALFIREQARKGLTNTELETLNALLDKLYDNMK